MSLVLAFGLSPLGQVPAYADEGLQTQAAELQAQAPNGTFGDVYFKIGASSYQAGGQTTPTYNGDLSRAVTFAVYDGGDGSAITNTDYDTYSLTLVKPDKSKQVADADHKTTSFTVGQAGTYTLTIEGVSGNYNMKSKEVTFEVGKLDLASIEGAEFVQLGADGSNAATTGNYPVYDGTNQTVAYLLKDTDLSNPVAATYSLKSGSDYTTSLDTVKGAGDYTAVLTGSGSCTGSVSVPVHVDQATLLTAAAGTASNKSATDASPDVHVSINKASIVAAEAVYNFSTETKTTDYTDAEAASYDNVFVAGFDPENRTSGGASATLSKIQVPAEKASNPIDVYYDGVKLDAAEYNVSYYSKVRKDGLVDATTKYASVADLPATKGSKYFALVTVKPTAPNFAPGTTQHVVVALEVAAGSDLNKIADHAVIAAGTYAGEDGVSASKSGAAFVDKDGNDVSDIVGENFKWVNAGDTQSFSYLSSNTAATAQLKVNTPVGAGDYQTTVVGDGTNIAAGTAIPAYFTVKPAATAEGDEIGQLKVTLANQAYTGDYVDPAPKIGIYTAKGKTSNVPKTVAKADTQLKLDDVTNWTVTYLKDGKQVSLPLEIGEYQAVFDFSGNLAGTQQITKTFTVDTGDITQKIAGIDSVSRVYTGDAIELDAEKDIKFLDEGGNAVSIDSLPGAKYDISYAAGSATPDADGKPVGSGGYTIRATFSGSYSGTVEGVLNVAKLNLSTLANCEIQYEQVDGAYDTVLSAPYTGSAIEPKLRVVVKDGKQKAAKATVVNEAVYTASFSDNVEKGSTAKVKLASADTNAVTTTGNVGEFKITDTSFTAIGASLTPTPKSTKYTEAGAKGPKVELGSVSAGTLTYYQVDSNGRAMGKASTYDVYYDATASSWKYADNSSGANTKDTAVSDQSTVVPTINYNYSLKVVDPKGNVMEAVPAAATDYVWGKHITIAGDPAKPTEVTIGQAVHNVDTDGKGTGSSTGTDVSEFKDAGEYTIVVGAGESGQYGGRVTAPFTVEGLDISTSDFSIVYTTDGGTSYLPFTDKWSVGYDATYAKSKVGITLTPAKDANRALKVLPSKSALSATGLVLDADYTVSYDENFKAGTAKVTFKGKGNYTGEVSRDFTIDRAKLPKYGTQSDGKTYGYQVDFITTATFKYDDVNKVYYTDYTGEAIVPVYEVNYYESSDGTDAKKTLVSKLDDEFAAQWVNNTHVTYDTPFPDIIEGAAVRISASDNYDGKLDGTFRIDPIDLYDNSAVTVSPVSEQVWTGKEVIPAVSVSLNGTALTQDKDYEVTLAAGDNGTDEGEHTALIASTGKGDVTVSTPIQVKYTIKKASEISYDLTGATVALSASKFTYDGKAQGPTVTSVTLKDGTLLDAALYTVAGNSKTAAGTYPVTVSGATANVTGNATATFTIAKAANTLKVAKAKRTAKGVSKAKKAVKGLKVKNAGQGAITYKKVSVNKNAKKFTVNSKTGKITVKKGTKKGTYKVTVKATAKGNSNYASASKQAVVTVKVKK